MPKPKIGLSMLYTLSEPFAKMIKELSKTQTAYVEIVDEGNHTLNRARVAKLNEIAKLFSLKFSVHAPFADLNTASLSKPILRASMKRLKQSMQYAADLDAYLWVFHPGNKSGISAFYREADWKQNETSIAELNDAAKSLGVRIAMENLPGKYNFLMKTPDNFQRFYKETGLDGIGIVLDTGHANLENQIQPFLKEAPEKIAHIHVSDNHGVIDEHLGVGHGKIDWQQFAENLKVTGFSGTVLVESVFDVQETRARLKALLA